MEDLNMFDNTAEIQEQNDLALCTRKTFFEFRVNKGEEGRFLQLLKALSSVEFKVNVDLDSLQIKEYQKCFLFRVRVSGKIKNLNIWNSILEVAAEFLRGDTGMVYLKKVCK